MKRPWSLGVATLLLVAAAVFRPAPASAQVITAEISGLVSDASGAVLPGATITARNLGTGFERVTVSAGTGLYSLLSLPVGPYTVTVEMSGFKTIVREGLELSLNQKVILDFKLSVATVKEEVTVIANAPLIQTTDGVIGQTITTEKVDSIPILGRAYTGLIALAPGVGDSNTIAGNAYYANTYKIDGMENDSESVAGAQSRVTLDAVGEVQVLTNQFSAEFGRALGGAVNVITRSGTNQVRGRGFFYEQNGLWNAKNYFALSQPLPIFTTRNYGGTIGGPIKKDKAFYFISVERITDDRPVVLRDPSGGPSQTLNRPTRQLTAFSKMTQQLNAKHTFQASFLYDTSKADGEGVSGINQPSNGFKRHINNYLFIANDVGVLSPTVVNEVRFQYQRRMQDSTPDTLQGPEIDRPSSITGRNAGLPFGWTENKIQFTDTITKILGNHSVKAGVNIQQLFNSPWDYEGYFGGQYVFDTDKPFDPNDKSTYPIKYTLASGLPTTSLNNSILGLFVEDTWKVNPRLTVNLGVRYDREAGPVVDVFKGFPDNNNIGPRLSFAWTPSNDRKTSIRGGYGRFYYRMYGNMGVNLIVQGALPPYGIGTTNTTVINYPGYPNPTGPNPRGTGTVQSLQSGGYSDGTEVTPYGDQVSIGFARQLGPTFAISADYVRTRESHDARAFDHNYPDPVTGLKPLSNFAQYWTFDTNGHMWYDGLMVRFDKRLSNRYQFNVAYTLAKTMDDTWPLFISQGGGPEAWWNPGAEKTYSAGSSSNAGYDERHRVVINGVVSLPAGFAVSGVITAHSPHRFNITTGRDNNGDGILTDRPNLVNGVYVDPGTGPGVAGNAPRNAGITGSYFQANARLSWQGSYQRYKLKLIGEVFNLTNRVNYTSYQGNIRSSLFNQAIAAAAGRGVQLGLQFDF